MRNIYLVFRRDYLGYVRAWGFWLGILSMPLLIAFGAFAAGLAASTTPVRYYTVLEDADVYGPAIEDDFLRTQRALEEGLAAAVQSTGISEEAAEQATQASAARLPRFVRVAPPASSVEALRPWLLGEQLVSGPDGAKPLFAVINVPQGGSEIEYWSENATVGDLRGRVESVAQEVTRRRFLAEREIDPDVLKQADEAAPDVLQRLVRTAEEEAASGNEVTLSDQAPRFIAVGLSYVLWFIIFSAGQYLLMGTIEERSNKIFDTLLTSVRLPQLLAGKLLAVLGVTLTMFVAWSFGGALFAALGASQMSDEMRTSIMEIISAGLQPAILVPTLISLVLGYLIYGVIFMALGSLCDTIQEAQTLLSPMLMLLMLPMLGIVFALEDPNSPLVTGASWVPIFTPFMLILRMPTEPPLWEVLAQIGLMAATAMIILWLATKVYRAGAVHGAGVGDALAWMKGLIPGLGKKKEA